MCFGCKFWDIFIKELLNAVLMYYFRTNNTIMDLPVYQNYVRAFTMLSDSEMIEEALTSSNYGTELITISEEC